MDFKLETEFSKAELLQEVDALKKQIDDMRPLPEDVEGRVMQKLRLDWNYHSNAIEGNRLTYGETIAFLMEGITAKGKPLKDHLDIRGHNDAINFLLSIIKETRPISEADIRSLHEMILVEPYDSKAKTSEGLNTTKRIEIGEYKTSSNHVKTSTGEIHYYATPEETPAKMQELMEWYNEASNNKDIHPVVLAALFHHKFVAIHPFDDGNGRLSRILMNLILMQKGYPPVVIKMDDRQNYYALLSRADNGDNWPFVEYIAERLQSSLQLFLTAAEGRDIDEDEDIDKELALFRMELQSKVTPTKKASNDEINKVILEVISPLIKKISGKLLIFDEFFDQVVVTLNSPGSDTVILKFRSFTDKGKRFHEEISNYSLLNEKIESLTLLIELTDFQNSDNIFSISDELYFGFEDQEYSIKNVGTETNIYKFYHQKLTTAEQNSIIKNIINNIKYLIDHHFKQ